MRFVAVQHADLLWWVYSGGCLADRHFYYGRCDAQRLLPPHLALFLPAAAPFATRHVAVAAQRVVALFVLLRSMLVVGRR